MIQTSHGFSLRWKVTIGFVSLIVVLGLLIITVIYYFTGAAFRDQFDQRVLAIATNLSDDAAAHVVRKNVLELAALVRKYTLLQGVEYAFIKDDKGAVIAHTLGDFPAELNETVSSQGRLQARKRALRFGKNLVYETSVPVLGGQVGTAHLGIRADFVESEIRRALLPTIWIIAVILLAGIVASCVFVSVMTGPIRRLSFVADRVSKGNLDTPVILDTGAHDEIGELACSLERMRSSLKAAMARFSDGPY